MKPVDFLVVGQGIAGTTLAWRLLERGKSVLVIDREEAVTSSKVAAGIINPVTGQRLTKQWKFDELFPAAEAFYRGIGERTGKPCFHRMKLHRHFAEARERRVFAERMKGDFTGLEIAAKDDGFECEPAGRLDVSTYLDTSREHFRNLGAYRNAEYPCDCGAERIVFCQGFKANPLFPVRFNPAKGEILTLRIDGLREDRIVVRGVWLLPLGSGIFKAGATYDRDNLDDVPTESGRASILERLRHLTDHPVEVLNHLAAVRPVIDEGKPTMLIDGRYGFFNGLGSKGSLLAPYFAERFADQLVNPA